MKCRTCKFFDGSRCRRRAPTPLQSLVDFGDKSAQWPTVGVNDWCGEYEPASSTAHMRVSPMVFSGVKMASAVEPISTPESLVYSITEASTAMDLSIPTIYRLIKSGRLSVSRVGRRTLIRRAEIERLLAEP